jgi:CheY-like chemotaxis protein
MIMESAERASGLTRKLLAFARKQPSASSAIDVHHTLNNTVELLKSTIDKRIEVDVNLKAKVSMVVGDPSQLQSAFLNLCINASQAMPEGGKLFIVSSEVSLSEKYCMASNFDLTPGEYIQIEIRDTGKGIKPDNLSRIFEPFFTTKAQGKGTGLGLAAVLGTVEQHAGAITVYSEVGIGTSFHVILPLSPDIKVTHFTPTPKKLKGTGTVLIIDDEAVMRVTASSILESLGYSVIVAEDGREGLEIFSERYKDIDVVLLDMIMPEMNGRDCFIKMKETDPDVRVILSSGFSREQDVKDMRENGLLGFIHKPYRIATLSKVIHDALNSN